MNGADYIIRSNGGVESAQGGKSRAAHYFCSSGLHCRVFIREIIGVMHGIALPNTACTVSRASFPCSHLRLRFSF